MNIILNEGESKTALYPFTATRHTADIRIGILTLREKWSHFPKFTLVDEADALFRASETGDTTTINLDACIIPTRAWTEELAAAATDGNTALPAMPDDKVKKLYHPWQIFQYNDWAIRQDFELVTTGRESATISSTNKLMGDGKIFLEAGARIEHSMLNTTGGPIYIGKNAEVQEGCMLRGPLAICEGAMIKMGAKIYGATTIGPFCVAAGEIKNSVIFGFSNKAHDGYLGDSVIGEWCNLGAGTTNSNVKNTAGPVKVWSKPENAFVAVGLKAGLLMGDYSRSAINTSFNTGTVVGVCCNIFGTYFPPKLVTDFTWGTEVYQLEKALTDIGNWKKLKGGEVTLREEEMIRQLYTQNKPTT